MAAAFTCISCRVTFQDSEIQRLHYKTDWHRYNLKRKIAELPPVTAEDFQRRVLQHRETAESKQEDVSLYCEPCRKTFGSQNAFDNHLQSKKHKEAEYQYVATQSEESLAPLKQSAKEEVEDVEEVDSDEWEDLEIEVKDCLFCEHHSSTIYKNLKHMSEAHSFFVPDFEFVSDLRGLMEYLGSKVKEGFMCLWCSNNNKAFWSLEATQQHMRDKGHCKVKHEGEALAEFIDFYDYTTSYPDRPEGEEDMEVDLPELDGADFQLTLPSGATIGHRSLFKYYRQSLNPHGPLALVKPAKKYLANYRAIGYMESSREAIAKKTKDIQFMRRAQAKLNMKIGVKANKLQHHFRAQVNF
ncbi:cytoplasmic 60S subunit biogenesis factor ZNF622 [Neocloeon triangulifer]|uniref:cytoplasmic 60S subunit biogenesis factor ZNF622 n=1 Tax=Neocloeon triangulifer TaxID=2078957 RepID=UPI00286F7E68|nr:cytoplasmic 60S subunit biogenesis factor ZNF622 [Neocloeon triangulifer]